MMDLCPFLVSVQILLAAYSSGTRYKISETAPCRAKELHVGTILRVTMCDHVRACARRWAGQQGQDFVANHQIPGIDFATFHSWVDNWLDDDISFQQNWIRQHAADAAAIGKPVRHGLFELQYEVEFLCSIKGLWKLSTMALHGTSPWKFPDLNRRLFPLQSCGGECRGKQKPGSQRPFASKLRITCTEPHVLRVNLACKRVWNLERMLKVCVSDCCAGMLQALLEEFGKWIKPGTTATQAERDSFYQAAYQEVLNVSPLSAFISSANLNCASPIGNEDHMHVLQPGKSSADADMLRKVQSVISQPELSV